MLAELHSISKKYNGNNNPVFENISLSVNRGDSIAITGPSGSGKSSLLNIIGTLDTASTGKILLNGIDVSSMTENQKADLRNRFIGFIFQQHHLLPQLSLLENILLPSVPFTRKKERKGLIERALELMSLLGIADLAGKIPGNASVGECQRTAVVRALINNPSLILADEPTGALDNDNAIKMAELLVSLPAMHQKALIVVTHSHEVASFMKTAYRLHSGKFEKA